MKLEEVAEPGAEWNAFVAREPGATLAHDAAWATAELLSGFVQREPMEGQTVSEHTEVRIVFDEEALYIGAWLYDREPGQIVFGQSGHIEVHQTRGPLGR